MTYIYLITNSINEKTYIGKRDCKDVLPEEDKYMSSSFILKGRGIYKNNGEFEKYGIKNFTKKILIQGNFSRLELNELERYYICLAKAIGKAEYNIAKGGSGGRVTEIVWNKGKSWSLEVRKKLSEANKQYCKEKHSQWGTHRTDETKKRISEALVGKYRGINSSHFGKKHSEEWKRHSSEALKGLMVGENHPRALKIVCINTGQIFKTIKDGASWGIGTSSPGICRCIANKAETCGLHPQTHEKLKWRHYEDQKT